MFKALPAVEKEFDMKEVGQSYPTWIRVVMIIFVIAIFFGAIFADWAYAADKYYVIKPEVKVLAFLGNPNSLDLIPVRFVTSEEQAVRFLHKRSGPGLYTFHLWGLLVKTDSGIPQSIEQEGYFIVKRKYIKPYK